MNNSPRLTPEGRREERTARAPPEPPPLPFSSGRNPARGARLSRAARAAEGSSVLESVDTPLLDTADDMAPSVNDMTPEFRFICKKIIYLFFKAHMGKSKPTGRIPSFDPALL